MLKTSSIVNVIVPAPSPENHVVIHARVKTFGVKSTVAQTTGAASGSSPTLPSFDFRRYTGVNALNVAARNVPHLVATDVGVRAVETRPASARDSRSSNRVDVVVMHTARRHVAEDVVRPRDRDGDDDEHVLRSAARSAHFLGNLTGCPLPLDLDGATGPGSHLAARESLGGYQ